MAAQVKEWVDHRNSKIPSVPAGGWIQFKKALELIEEAELKVVKRYLLNTLPPLMKLIPTIEWVRKAYELLSSLYEQQPNHLMEADEILTAFDNRSKVEEY